MTPVHTVGINWDSVGTIGGFIVAAMAFIYALMERRSRSIKQDITNSVSNLEQLLIAKLETKDAVTNLRISMETKLAEQHAQISILQARTEMSNARKS